MLMWLYLYRLVFRDDGNQDSNLRVGIIVVISFFLVISVLAFPNGENPPLLVCVAEACAAVCERVCSGLLWVSRLNSSE